jgi:hypothetical protein
MEKPQAEQAGAAEEVVQGTTALEPVRVTPPRFQPALMATVIGAIILAIAIGAFWTSF